MSARCVSTVCDAAETAIVPAWDTSGIGRRIQLLREGFQDRPELDVAVGAVLLEQVSVGRRPETLRIHQPGRTVAFGRQDVRLPGYRAAVEAARSHGYQATERLAGGRAAVFHPGTIAVGWAIPAREPRSGIDDRFDEIADIIMTVLRRLGIDARVGEIEGEYCPGRHSISVRGERKLFGVGQRIVSKAAHLGAVLVVEGASGVRSVLDPVYRALRFPWNPDTTGDLRGAGVRSSYAEVVDSLIGEFSSRYLLEETVLDSLTVSRAQQAAPRYLSPNSSSTIAQASESGSMSDMWSPPGSSK